MRFVIAAVLITTGLFSAALAGPAGTLDPTFGVGGRVVSRHLAFNFIVQAPDGDIIAVGKNRNINGGVLVRYQSDGSLDPSFGTGGVIDDPTVLTSGLSIYGSFFDLAMQPDGKFLDLIEDRVTFAELVRRHLPSGALDPSFDGDGILSVPLASHLAIQADGSIVVVSLAPVPPNNTDWDIRLSRYDSSGAVDPSFGTGGSVVTNVGTREQIFAIALQPDGRIVVTGTTGAQVSSAFLLRYLPGGSLDPSFGTLGKVVETPEATMGHGLALQPDGKILTSRFQLARRDSNGALDPTFGVGGIGSTFVVPHVVQPDGRILGVAEGRVRRLMPDGSVDVDFGDAGVSETSTDSEGVGTLLRQADGRIVTTINFGDLFPLERYLGGTCGDTVVEGGEECDDGNATAGDGCEPGCCLADSDGDGRCDAHDPCTSPAPTDALVMFSGAGTNHHKFKLKGSVELPSAPVAFDPLANGVRIVVREAGVYLYDFTLPGGALASPPGYGWTANGSRIWKFTGSVTGPYTGVPIFANVTSLKIARTNSMPNRLKFAVKTRFVREDPVSSVTATLVLDPPTATTGECAEVTLPCLASGTSVRCRL